VKGAMHPGQKSKKVWMVVGQCHRYKLQCDKKKLANADANLLDTAISPSWGHSLNMGCRLLVSMVVVVPCMLVMLVAS